MNQWLNGPRRTDVDRCPAVVLPSHGENRGSSPLGSANDFKDFAEYKVTGANSRGSEAAPVDQRRSLHATVRDFDAFADDSGPHGEHDFGAIDFGGVRRFRKIDCYDRPTEIGRPIPPLPPSPCAC